MTSSSRQPPSLFQRLVLVLLLLGLVAALLRLRDRPSHSSIASSQSIFWSAYIYLRLLSSTPGFCHQPPPSAQTRKLCARLSRLLHSLTSPTLAIGHPVLLPTARVSPPRHLACLCSVRGANEPLATEKLDVKGRDKKDIFSHEPQKQNAKRKSTTDTG